MQEELTDQDMWQGVMDALTDAMELFAQWFQDQFILMVQATIHAIAEWKRWLQAEYPALYEWLEWAVNDPPHSIQENERDTLCVSL